MSNSATPWIVAHQAPLSVGFSRQEYWNRLPLSSPGDLPNPGIKSGSPALQVDSLSSEPPGKPHIYMYELSCSVIPTLCNPMDCSLSGSSVHGIHQARILEWVVISFSRGSSQPRDRTWVSHIAGRFFTIWATRKFWSWWSIPSLNISNPGASQEGLRDKNRGANYGMWKYTSSTEHHADIILCNRWGNRNMNLPGLWSLGFGI